MLILPVIPFLLGYMAQRESDDTPTYIFHVRVDTLFLNKSNNREGNAGLAFNLKCRPHTTILKCHIPVDIFYSPSTDPVHMVEYNNFTPSSLDFSKIRYRMSFDINGVMEYRLLTEDVVNRATLLDMYRLIGDQLSIGTDVRSKGLEFNTTENSIIGTCPTLYKIFRQSSSNANNFKLHSLINSPDFKLKGDESLHISKHRHVDDCFPQHGYILGQSLWTDLISPSNLIVRTKGSQTLMTLAKRDFYTKSINTFNLYDKENRITVGYVHETINVRLISVEI